MTLSSKLLSRPSFKSPKSKTPVAADKKHANMQAIAHYLSEVNKVDPSPVKKSKKKEKNEQN